MQGSYTGEGWKKFHTYKIRGIPGSTVQDNESFSIS